MEFKLETAWTNISVLQKSHLVLVGIEKYCEYLVLKYCPSLVVPSWKGFQLNAISPVIWQVDHRQGGTLTCNYDWSL